MLIINNKISLIPHAPANRAVAHSGIGTEMWGQPPEAPFATAPRNRAVRFSVYVALWKGAINAA